MQAMYASRPPTSDIRDRTLEFHQSVASFNKRVNRGAQQQPQPSPATKKSEFHLRASQIAKDISHTSELLGKLALLAKKKPMFDDRPQEISELTYVIKQDIVKIEKNLKNLQAYAQTGADQPNEQLKTNSKNIVQLLNTKMKNVSGNFKEVLETRQKTEMENKSRKEKFFSSVQSTTTGPVIPSTVSDNPFLMDDSQDSPNTALLQLPQDQQMQLLEEQATEYLQDRNRAVETIESTIQEVGNLFQQLATMVNEQSEVIQRIDTNVQDIDMNVMGAQRELLKYFKSISNNRWLYLKVFGVLLMFFIMWILVN
ncbi:CYFA0S31e00518g1_1 [Cyberlindnera fabianii]|uniref:CYFA0S31e00518g1_1 n=1 Tax=Cyberlindnera fabianii TaxID=36022 RepID=A0A061BBL7_CYBFA|nr:CYFA0S31e00518g1_1 [Cyberlindnera fabianii]